MAEERAAQGREIRVHLLRHAHAGDAFEWIGDDDLRPLTRKGRQQAERLGAFLEAHGIRPDVIVSSPLVRARQTAEIVAEALGMTIRTDRRLGTGFGKRELWAVLDETGGREVMLVGHDPDFTSLLTYLLDAAGVRVRKGALATVDLHTRLGDGEGELRWLLPPDLLTED
ncbi:MAG: histidine phosphatase family protein [Candidatus Limnocylindrales bacterium]